MSRFLHRLGATAARRHWLVIALWGLLAAGAITAGQLAGAAPSDSLTIPDSDSQDAFDILQAEFPAEWGSTTRIVFAVEDGRLDEPARKAGIDATLQQARAVPHVIAVVDPFSPEGFGRVSRDGRIAFAELRYEIDGRAVGSGGIADLVATEAPAEAAGVQVEYGGDIVERQNPEQARTSEIIGLTVAMVVLLVAFGSVMAMGVPLVTALGGLAIGLSLIRVLAAHMSVTSVAPILASMIGIAVGIDYALFVVSRYRQQLAAGNSVIDAVGIANATAGQAVIFAGATVVIAILGLSFVGIPLVTSLGVATSIVVAVAVLIAVTLLPAMLGLIGERIDRLRVPFLRVRQETDTDSSNTVSARWARRVCARPWRHLIPAVAVLAVLAVPALSLELGWPGAGNRPESATERRAYDLMAEGFGPGFNGPLVAVVELGPDATPEAQLQPVAAAIQATSGVLIVAPPRFNADRTTAVLPIIPKTSPQDRATTDLVHRLRDETIPNVNEPAYQRVLITGSTAAFIDISGRLTERLPIFIGAVVVLSFLLLTAVFRSPLVALKAALVNLLGIAASYGILVAVFQWGWGIEALGLEQAIPIISFLPMMMFAVLFGLSMDYEVFILSRVREEWTTSHDATGSVVHGLASSARVITAAALIMVSVFASFILGDGPEMKMFGLGLAVAVLLDATIIRMIVVPATMTLLGSRNWWLPGWLDRILPNVDIEGSTIDLTDPSSEPSDPEPVLT